MIGPLTIQPRWAP